MDQIQQMATPISTIAATVAAIPQLLQVQATMATKVENVDVRTSSAENQIQALGLRILALESNPSGGCGAG